MKPRKMINKPYDEKVIDITHAYPCTILKLPNLTNAESVFESILESFTEIRKQKPQNFIFDPLYGILAELKEENTHETQTKSK